MPSVKHTTIVLFLVYPPAHLSWWLCIPLFVVIQTSPSSFHPLRFGRVGSWPFGLGVLAEAQSPALGLIGLGGRSTSLPWGW